VCHVCFDLYVIDLCVIDLSVMCVFVRRCGRMDGFISVACCTHMCDMTHSYVRHDVIVSVA